MNKKLTNILRTNVTLYFICLVLFALAAIPFDVRLAIGEGAAAVVLLIVFTAAMELLPRLTLRGDDALAVAEAEYRAMCAFDKYGSGVWPAGTYVERYGGSEATVRVEPYRQYNDVQLITIEVRIDGSRKRIVHRQLVECAE